MVVKVDSSLERKGFYEYNYKESPIGHMIEIMIEVRGFEERIFSILIMKDMTFEWSSFALKKRFPNFCEVDINGDGLYQRTRNLPYY